MKRSRPAQECIGEIRDTLTKRFQRLVYARAKATGMCISEFREWVNALVGEGIAVALSDINDWNEEKGDFLYWAFLKTRSLFTRDLRKMNKRVETVLLSEYITGDHQQRHDPEKRLQVKEQLKEIFELLTRDQGEAVVFRYLMGFSVKEMEALTGRPGINIYSLLARAKTKAKSTRAADAKDVSSNARDQTKIPQPRTSTDLPDQEAR